MQKGLSNRRGEVFTTTAVKVIIAVVVGVLILGGLFALYRNVIFPKLNQKVEGMIHTEDTVQVRKDGNSVQYSYDGETWKDCTIPGVSASATVSTVLLRSVRFLHEPIRKRLLSLRLSRTEAAPACMSAVTRRSGFRPSETANRFPSATELRM